MRDYISILGALMAGVFFWMSFNKGLRWQPLKRRRARSPALMIGTLIGFIVVVYGATSGRYHLAYWLYDTPSPTRDQLRTARALLFSPFAVSLAAVLAWAWWSERKGIKEAVRSAQYRPRFVDPSRESRVQIEKPGGGTSA